MGLNIIPTSSAYTALHEIQTEIKKYKIHLNNASNKTKRKFLNSNYFTFYFAKHFGSRTSKRTYS